MVDIGRVTGNAVDATVLHEVEIRGLILDPVSNTPIVILKKPEENLFLPIWIVSSKLTPSLSSSRACRPRGP